jgi:hypothetical protein
LIDDPDSPALGRLLITSANADAPSADARTRAARRLGIAAVLVAGATAGTEATAVAAVGKLVAVLFALGGAVGLAVWQSPPDVPPEHVQPVTSVASSARAAHGEGVVTPRLPPPSPPVEVVAPEPREDAAALAPASPPSVPPLAPRPAPVRPPQSSHGAPAKPPARVSRVAPADVASPVPEASPTPEAPAPEVPAPEAPAPEPPALVEPIAPPAPVEAPPAVAPPAPKITGPSQLAAEVALVDRARSQLRAGNHVAALATLAAYRQRFPRGDLDAEADVVTIEARIAARDFAHARDLGSAFLVRFPRSPLAQRVRSLLDRLPARRPN